MKLKKLRLEKKFTQKNLASILNMSETGYASWEQGLSEPNIDAIRKICEVLEVTADELLELNEFNENRTITKTNITKTIIKSFNNNKNTTIKL